MYTGASQSKWYGREDSNPQPSDPKSDALSIELLPHTLSIYRGLSVDASERNSLDTETGAVYLKLQDIILFTDMTFLSLINMGGVVWVPYLMIYLKRRKK